MKKYFLFIVYQLINLSIITLSLQKGYAQGVGINSTGAAPHTSSMLHVDVGTSTTKGVLVTGTFNFFSSTVPDLGAGTRLMFYPGKAAFRAGSVDGTQWNNANVGNFSTAMGNSTIASDYYSTAMGYNTTASGISSTAMGSSTTASGYYSTAMGINTTASGTYSTAMGNFTTASGFLSTAMGYGVNTNNQQGAFAIGDSDPNNEGITYHGVSDQFVARFWNGYYLMTSGNTTRFGVQIGHNGNAWLSICDKNRKENFEQLNGEEVLQKLSKIKFTSWNYKQQDPKIYRHYGITAQDFYNAFGKDKYGTIGNDTTVNPIDMIGIDMAAIQALEKRTADLKVEGERQRAEAEKLKSENDKLKKEVAGLNKKFTDVDAIKKENENLKQAIAQLQQQFKILDAKQTDKVTVALK